MLGTTTGGPAPMTESHRDPHPDQRSHGRVILPGASDLPLASHLAAKGDSLAHSASGTPLGREESSNGGSLAVHADGEHAAARPPGPGRELDELAGQP